MKNVIKAPALALVAVAALLAGCQTSGAVQHAQAAHSVAQPYKPGNLTPINVSGHGIKFKRSRDGFGYINDMMANHTESNEWADVYETGIYAVIVYKKTTAHSVKITRITGKRGNQFVGDLK